MLAYNQSLLDGQQQEVREIVETRIDSHRDQTQPAPKSLKKRKKLLARLKKQRR